MFKTRIKPSYYDSGYKTETNVLHMSVRKKKPLQPCVPCKASAASSLKFKSIFFLRRFFVGFSHISVSNVFIAFSAFTKLTDEKGPLLDGGGKEH